MRSRGRRPRGRIGPRGLFPLPRLDDEASVERGSIVHEDLRPVLARIKVDAERRRVCLSVCRPGAAARDALHKPCVAVPSAESVVCVAGQVARGSQGSGRVKAARHNDPLAFASARGLASAVAFSQGLVLARDLASTVARSQAEGIHCARRQPARLNCVTGDNRGAA